MLLLFNAKLCPTLCDLLWTAARQASLYSIISQSFLKLTTFHTLLLKFFKSHPPWEYWQTTNELLMLKTEI